MTVTSSSTITTVSLPDGKDTDLLTLAEAAAIARLSESTMRHHRFNGTGPRFFKVGRYVMTTVGDLRAWLEALREKS